MQTIRNYTRWRTRTIPALFGLGLLVATMTGCSSYGSTYLNSTRPAMINFTSQNFSYMGCLPFQRQSKTTGTSTHRNVCRPIVRMTIPYRHIEPITYLRKCRSLNTAMETNHTGWNGLTVKMRLMQIYTGEHYEEEC